MLDALAVLTGHTVELPAIPDGARPDVARLDLVSRRIFLGDAKAAETAGSRATLARALRYARWLPAGVGAGYSATFAVCFGRGLHSAAWRKAIEMLLFETGLTVHCSVVRLTRGVWCAWATVPPTIADPSDPILLTDAPDRDLGSHPQAGPNEVVDALSDRGQSFRRPDEQHQVRKDVEERPSPGRKRAASSNSAITADQLIEAKRLADSLGGVDQAQKALETLRKLQ